MSDITVEKKMQLIQQVRSQYNRNQNDLMNRERILYGRTSTIYNDNEQPVISSQEKEGMVVHGTFRLRFFLSVVLVVAVVIFDKNNTSLFGITTNQIFESIAKDFGVTEWSRNLPGELPFLNQE